MNIIKTILIFLVFVPFLAGQEVIITKKQKNVKEFVYLLHGLGRSKTAMWLLASRLEDAGYLVERIGYSSLNRSPDEILADVSQQIGETIPQEGQSIHFVGHSLGGLLIRAYLDSNNVKNLGHVVLLGTPNNGTPLVDYFRDSWWFQLLGPTTLALGTDKDSFPNSISDPYYPVGVIAGVTEGMDNDLFLPGKDDGLVPLESTKLNGMTDMIVVESGHSMMRYNEEVASQTIVFLCTGKFEKYEDRKVEFIVHAINWCKGEIFEGRMFALFGFVLIVLSIFFWRLGSTEFAKAMFIPLLLVGLFCVFSGASLNFKNKSRIVEYEKSWQENAEQFVLSEKQRTEAFIKWYPATMYGMAAFIVIGLVLYLVFGPSPHWRAAGLGLILFGLSVLFLDHFSEERAAIYHQHIEAELETDA